MSKQANTDKLGTMPIGKLLPSMAIPMMLSFFIQALYYFVDSIFIARVSENALAAVSLTFPVTNIMCAIAVGVGIGMSVSVSRSMGKGDVEKADAFLNTGLTVLFFEIAVFMLFGIFFANKFFTLQTDVADIVISGTTYLRIITIGCAFMVVAVYIEKALVSVGYSFYSMLALGIAAVWNIIFDPILIFGLGPFPKLGIMGAAIATVSAQFIECSIALGLFIGKNKSLRFHLGKLFKISGKDVGQILRIGFPSMIAMSLTAVASFLVNQILLTYSTTATACYGIWIRLQDFCFMPGFGLNNGMLPILSYNMGKGNMDRVRKTIRYALMTIITLMIILTVVFLCIPVPLLKLFDASPNMMEIGKKMLSICLLSLPFGGVSIVMGSAMQAVGGEKYTTILNFLRNLVISVPCFFIIYLASHNLNLEWWAVPGAEFISLIFAIFFFGKVNKKIGL